MKMLEVVRRIILTIIVENYSQSVDLITAVPKDLFL